VNRSQPENMLPVSQQTLNLLLLLVSSVAAVALPDAVSADLKPETLAAFSCYVNATEARIANQQSSPETLLYIDGHSGAHRRDVQEVLKGGQVFIEQLETKDASGHAIHVPAGLIHHWIGDVFIPGVSIRLVLDLLQDYNHHQDIYQANVIRSRLISREGNHFHIAQRYRERKVVTVVLNTEHEVDYTQMDATHWFSRSVSTRIAQVQNAGSPDESEKPVGDDSGFLWRINSYWRFLEQDGGVYVECESISLTRDIPTGLGWLIRPYVTSIPKDSLERTLGATRSAVLRRSTSTGHGALPVRSVRAGCGSSPRFSGKVVAEQLSPNFPKHRDVLQFPYC